MSGLKPDGGYVQAIPTTTVYWLVAVSVVTSILASYSAFSFAERVTSSKGSAYFLWLAGGALSMGLGIWSMHYLGMLSVQLPVEVLYHLPTVLLSLLLAVLASVVVLVVVSRRELTAIQVGIGSILMGSGIGAMHYTGMHAMRSTAMHHYRLSLVLLSIVVAVAFSWMSLWITFSMGKQQGQREWVRLGGASVMGLGIAAMHYTAMTAVTFLPCSTPYSTRASIRITDIGVAAVVFTTVVVLFSSMIAAVLDRRLFEQISIERDQLHAAAESSMDCLYLCSALRNRRGNIIDFVIQYVNSNVEQALGLPIDALIGGRMSEVLPMEQQLGHFELYKRVVLTGEPLAIEFMVPSQGEEVWLRVQAVKMRDGVAITAADISVRKKHEEAILHMAHHDSLTGLVNRSLLHDRLGQAIARAQRHNKFVGVFMIDMDGFKQINDTFGHQVGDSFLVSVAVRLQSAVRSMDSIIRIGGDEFLVVMPEIKDRSQIEPCAERLLESFYEDMEVDGHLLQARCSLGVSIFPESGRTIEDLIRKADGAMYAAKRNGKNQYRVCAPEGQAPELDEVFPGHSATKSADKSLTAALPNPGNAETGGE